MATSSRQNYFDDDSAPRVRAGDGTADFAYPANLHSAAARAAPFTVVGQDYVALELTFDSLDDFRPDAIARKVDALRARCEKGTRLVDMLSPGNDDTRAEEFMAWMMGEPPPMATAMLMPTPMPMPTPAAAPAPAASPAPRDADVPAVGDGQRPKE